MVRDIMIRRLRATDAPVIASAFQSIGWTKTVEQYERYAREDEQGQRTSFVAEVDDEFAGYCTLLWESDYPAFREAGIPEVSDLNVLPPFRNFGVGNRLLDTVEAVALERGPSVGLGVGLYSDYGPAQRIYVRRGYVPDGRGLMYDNTPVERGTEVCIDDDATLMMVRVL
jgi:GNAT superfamily N-acetyltransferase